MRNRIFNGARSLLSMMILLSTSLTIEGGSNKTKVSGDPKGIIHPFKYDQVQLLDGRLKDQFEEVKDFYFSLQDNALLRDYRERAGLYAHQAPSIGGAFIKRGLTFGQWLGAFARMYQITGDDAIRVKAIHLMDEWAKTIDGHYDPDHYTFDKDVQGLVDMYEYLGTEQALDYLAKITSWGEKNLDRSNPYALPSEWYTLSENLYRAYELTGDKRYFDFAKVWEYTDYWGAYARNENIFQVLENSERKGYHSYSHVNTLSSAAMAYKVTGDRRYLETIFNAYQFLKDTQLFATGGFGPEEQMIVPEGLPETLLPVHHGKLNTNLVFHFETACGSWAGFKLSRYLMTFTGEAHYGDWIERLIYNGIGAQPPMNDAGMIMYGSQYHLYGARKFFSTTWFCCQGSRPLAISDYHNLIYFQDKKNIYVNLFVPSQVEWNGPGGMVTIVQETRFPERNTTTLKVQPKVPSKFGLKFRVPEWAHGGVKVTVNNKPFKTETVPGKWATIQRKWRSNDEVKLQFDLTTRLEPLPGYIAPTAVMRGPVVMVMTTASESENRMPTEADLRFPADWLIGRSEKINYTSSPTMEAPINRNHRLRSSKVFRPYYELKPGEFYRMYFEFAGEKSIPADELVYHGNWIEEGGMRYSNEPGSTFEGTFEGTTVIWEGARLQDAGMAKISIDGKEIANVDQYAYSGVKQRLNQSEVPFRWSISDLTGGKHTIKVTILPHKNAESDGTKINVRNLKVY